MLRRMIALLAVAFATSLTGPTAIRADTAADAVTQAQAQVQEPRTITVTVLGMSCPFCAYGLQKKLRHLEGVEKVEVKLKEGLAILTLKPEVADISDETIKKLVEDAGFEAAKIERNFTPEKKPAGAH